MKEKVGEWSEENPDPFAHLRPIVQALLARGNEGVHADPFFLDKDGWICLLKRPIDFDYLESRFEFPPSIRLSREHGSILDLRTWVEIRSV